MGDDSSARIERLERAVERLERDVEQLRSGVDRSGPATTRPPAWSAPAWSAPAPPTATPRRAEPPWPPPSVRRPMAVRQPIAVDSEVVLKWGGVGLVVLAVGFAVSTAISRGWIGPELQLAGAALVSLGLIAAGLRVRSTRPGWTHALCAAGVAAAYTTVASDLFLDQATDDVALAVTVGIGIGGFALARATPSQWVGSTALVGGVVGWSVIVADDLDVLPSVAWFAVAAAIAIGLALERTWFALRFAGHVVGMSALLPVAAEAQRTGERVAVMAVALLVATSMVRVPSVGDLTSVWQRLEIQLVVVLAPWAFGVTAIAFETDGDRAVGSTALGAAAVVVVVALALRRRITGAHLVSLLVGASIATTIGLAVLLATSWVLASLAVQGAGLVVLARALGDDVRILANAAVLSVVSGVSTLGSMLDAWTFDVPWADDVAHLAVVVALAVAAWRTGRRTLGRVSAVAILGLTLVWLGSVLVHLPQGQALVSVSWAVSGAAVLLAGALRREPDVGLVGLAVLALTVGKLLSVDLREVDTLWRAGLFFLVGLGFLRLGFLLPRLSAREPDDEHPDRDAASAGTASGR